jgi:hypothetical protein
MRELADLIAKRFIARPDVKAIQNADGTWKPHTTDGRVDSPKLPWKRPDLVDHLTGTRTFGHYLLSTDNNVKLFAFDIDLEENKPADHPRPYTGHWVDDEGNVHEFDAREAWKDRAHPSRSWSKYQLKMVASKLMARIHDELSIPCAAAYSGGKGVHVYGFTGLMSATEAREGAMIALDSLGGWEPTRGDNFFHSIDQDPTTGYPNLSIELFPKQNTLTSGGLGNLMRIPLGKNLKNPKDPTFFLDMTSPMGQMKPVDPIYALTGNPWKMPYE